MLIEGGSLRRVYRKPCLIIYQRRHRRCCRSIPSHQFAAVPPCSQRRHILIYLNVLHTNNPSQFPNRANHPIALTLPAIQGAPPLPPFYWTVPGHRFPTNDAPSILQGVRHHSAEKNNNRCLPPLSPSIDLRQNRSLRHTNLTPKTLSPALWKLEIGRFNDEESPIGGWYGVSRREYKAEGKNCFRGVRIISNLSPLSISSVEFFAPLREISLKTRRSRDVRRFALNR